MTTPHPLELDRLTSDEARDVVEGEATPVVLVPVASTEPHGPHLPLGTDAVVSSELCRRAAKTLRAQGIAAFVAPAVPYGVADHAEGFAGAVSIPAETVRRLVADVCRAYLRDGWRHVSVVNSHLETAQAAALHASAVEVNESGGGADDGPVPVSLPSVLSRRWQSLLTDEGHLGHAGRYETSLMLAASDDLVRRGVLEGLPEQPPQAEDAPGERPRGLRERGADRGYLGDPAAASLTEGEALFTGLTRMVVTEVLEALGREVPDDL